MPERIVSTMDQFDVQHSCDGEMVAGFSPHASCTEVAGLGWGGILVAIAIFVGLGLIGWLLWRRIKNRGDIE